jgi:hypothetical protein
MRLYLRRKLLEARRSDGEFEAAKNAYDKTRQKLEAILNTWDLRGQEQIDKNRRQLRNAYAFISRKADGFIEPAFQKVLQQWGLVDRESDSESTNPLQHAPSGAEYTNEVGICLLLLDQMGLILSLECLDGDFRGSCKRISSSESGGTSRPTLHAQVGIRRCRSTSRARGEIVQDHHVTRCTGECHYFAS